MQPTGDGSRRKQRFRERLDVLHDTSLHQRVKQHLPTGRWTRRHWIHASLFTTIGILVATIVPGFSHIPAPSIVESTTTLHLPLPHQASTGTATEMGDDGWEVVRIKSGQTLSSIFSDMDIPASVMLEVMKQPSAKASLRNLRPGVEIALKVPEPGKLQGLRFDADASHRVELTLDGDAIKENVVERESTTRTVVLSGKVGRSLNRSARKAGLTSANIRSLTDDIFKYDIDFNSDLDADDRFSVVVEQTWREGELVSTGPVEAATFTVDGKLHSGFRFARPGHKPEYYTAAGRPLKKSFIRMPIPYARLSSRFGARKHPVLGRMRMHKGVDYAASTGTPIMAAGDAKVQFIGWQRGYGRTVVLDHGQGTTTLYGHMSRTANLKKGQRIAQGTVIGYVGSTGLATGPHLHYEFRVNGVHRNPLNVTMPPPQPLAGSDMVAFKDYTSSALARIRTVEDIIYADLDDAPAQPQVASTGQPASKNKKG
ncbi:M23 family metallopeptidase [Pseudoxanthomonas dokdonensis]|uniref:Membrane protein n=1 Tax=Pseudoxanthomonas dokdonensis TaxID=344882 RepID=A0A0R0D0B9_9GAMM|nr:peptidoglycan DD-metalloendopeptidase family protein [Pseudoxanthomonas dokdonensis]KRG71902.1 membrane protein [Pseudoxanthomonas dokdonensis]